MSLFNYSRPRDNSRSEGYRERSERSDDYGENSRGDDRGSYQRRPGPRFRASHKAYVKTMFFSTEHAEVRPLAGNFSRGFLRWSAGGKSFRMLKVGDGDRSPVEGDEEEQYITSGVAYFRAQFDVTLLSSEFEENPVNVFIGYKLYAPENCIHKAAFIPGGLHRFYLEHHYHMDGWMRRAGFAFVKDGEEISLFNHHPDGEPGFFVLRNEGGEVSVQKQ